MDQVSDEEGLGWTEMILREKRMDSLGLISDPDISAGES
jgi:hypothetical protein